MEKGKAKQIIHTRRVLLHCIDQPFPQHIQKLYYIVSCRYISKLTYRRWAEGVLGVKAKHASTVWCDT